MPGVSAAARLGLGTVQFGQDYAIAADEGRPGEDDVGRILDLAAGSGIEVLDTASLYGNAEEIVGRCLAPDHGFRIVAKTATFPDGAFGPEEAAELRRVFLRTLENLRADRVHALIAHKAANLLGPGGEHLFDEMRRLRDEGRAGRIGVSVYTAAQIDALLARYPVEFVQAPVSIFDQRLIANGQLRRMKDMGIEVHARSVFLKGLVFAEPERLPAHFDAAKPQIAAFRRAALEAGRSPMAAALSFALARPEIDTVLVGVTSAAQLREILDAANATDFAECGDAGRFALDGPEILNPALWPDFRI